MARGRKLIEGTHWEGPGFLRQSQRSVWHPCSNGDLGFAIFWLSEGPGTQKTQWEGPSLAVFAAGPAPV